MDHGEYNKVTKYIRSKFCENYNYVSRCDFGSG